MSVMVLQPYLSPLRFWQIEIGIPVEKKMHLCIIFIAIYNLFRTFASWIYGVQLLILHENTEYKSTYSKNLIRGTMLDRILKIKDAEEESVFLFGARQTGKTTLLL